MEAQSQEGFILLITIAALCVAIFITAFALTFLREADTDDNKGH